MARLVYKLDISLGELEPSASFERRYSTGTYRFICRLRSDGGEFMNLFHDTDHVCDDQIPCNRLIFPTYPSTRLSATLLDRQCP